MSLRAALLGGLVAGLLINLSGMGLAHFVLGPDYVKAFLQHVSGPPSSGTLDRPTSPSPSP
jgi:hypothetical protein